MKIDPLDNPTRNAATMRNLVGNLRLLHIDPWLEEVTLTQVIEAHWAAQLRKADREERRLTSGRVRE